IEMNEREISPNWVIKHNIFTKSEKDKLDHLVTTSVFSFKLSRVESRINDINTSLKADGSLSDDDRLLLMEKRDLEIVKIKIAKKLGRIVLR
ncbi:MAG: hypothetical protein P8P74_11970, partial [Crocinitomicaceae bacterium]|nr:hypothetical protein [Crocinitomicaceae bacterium]